MSCGECGILLMWYNDNLMKYLMKNYDYKKDAAVKIIDQVVDKTLAELFRKKPKKRIQDWFQKHSLKQIVTADVLLDQDYLDETPIIVKNRSKCYS